MLELVGLDSKTGKKGGIHPNSLEATEQLNEITVTKRGRTGWHGYKEDL